VWAGSSFPFTARLTIESLLLADPQAQVEVHVLGPHPTTAHFTSLNSDPSSRVTIHDIDIDSLFDGLGATIGHDWSALLDSIPEGAFSAQSNLLRYALLYRRGGVYVDFDVLALRPLHDLADGKAFIGCERVWIHDEARVEGRWRWRMTFGTVGWALSWFAKRSDSKLFGGSLRLARLLRAPDQLWTRLQANNAIVGAPAGSPFIHEVLRRCGSVKPTVRYALGPTLVSAVVRDHPHLICVVPESTLYPVPPSESHRFFEDRTLSLAASTAAIHYVNSNHRKLIRDLEPGDVRFDTRPELFWRVARSIIAGLRPLSATADAQ